MTINKKWLRTSEDEPASPERIAEDAGWYDAHTNRPYKPPRHFKGKVLTAYRKGFFIKQLSHHKEIFRDAARIVLKTEIGLSDQEIHRLHLLTNP